MSDFSQEPVDEAATLNERWVTVRVSIPIYGKPRGALLLVDSDDPEIQGLIGASWLVPVGEPDELPLGE